MSLNVFEYVNNLPVALYKENEIVFSQDDPSDGRMYFVAEGELTVRRRIEGDAHELNRLHPGDFFGEMAILNRMPRSATIQVTSKHAKLGYLDEAMFIKIAKVNPVFHYSLLKLVIQRIAQIEDDIEAALEELRGLEE